MTPQSSPVQSSTAARSHSSTLLGWSAFLLILGVYASTLCPTIPGGDSGELIGAAHTLGVAHPPGYPLFTLLAKLFSLLPIGSIAYRVNLMSAVCDAGAATLLLLTLLRWRGSRWAAGFAAAMYAFCPLIWRYAVVAEVFPLNNLISALFFYLVVRFVQDKSLRCLSLAALVAGLGMANHHTFLFQALPISLWVLWWDRRRLLQGKRLLVLAGWFVLGLAPYLYLPWADSGDPLYAWGEVTSVSGFLDHLLRREYGTFQLLGTEKQAGEMLVIGLWSFLQHVVVQSLGVGCLLAVFALWKLRSGDRVPRGLLLASLAAFLLYVLVFHYLANLHIEQAFYLEIHKRFWQMPVWLVFLWAGLGLTLVPWPQRLPSWSLRAVASVAVLLQVGLFYGAENQRHNRTLHYYGSYLLGALPRNALFLSLGDLDTNVLRYLQQAEGVRADVTVVDQELLQKQRYNEVLKFHYPNLQIPGNRWVRGGHQGAGSYNLKQLFDANLQRGPIFVSDLSKEQRAYADSSWVEDYEVWPFGMVSQVLRRQEDFDEPGYMSQVEESWAAYDVDQIVHVSPGFWEELVWRAYWDMDLVMANRLVEKAQEGGNKDRALLDLAIERMERMRQRVPYHQPSLFRNLGFAYYLRFGQDPQGMTKAVEAWSLYLSDPITDDPNLPSIVQMVRAWRSAGGR